MSETILITGGAGDLASSLAPQLESAGYTVRLLDPVEARTHSGTYIRGSVLDRDVVANAMDGVSVVVHAAAWHGIHEGKAQRNVHEFWDVNMTGTANVLEAMSNVPAAQSMVYISSTSQAYDWSFYGLTKVLGEQLVAWYVRNKDLNAVALRPPSFIPWTNHEVYKHYTDWAREYWSRSAMHVEDVALAARLACEALLSRRMDGMPVIPLSGRDDIPVAERDEWDRDGSGSSFLRLFPKYFSAAHGAGFRMETPPIVRDILAARQLLGFEPRFGISDVLEELAAPAGEIGRTS